MTRDIIDINDFTILVETCRSDEPVVDVCRFEEALIAVAFYGSGNVGLNVNYGDKRIKYDHTKGLALSFYADKALERKRGAFTAADYGQAKTGCRPLL